MSKGVPGKGLWEVKHGDVNAAMNALGQALEGNGEAFVQLLNSSFDRFDFVYSIVTGAWFCETKEEIALRQVMGDNFLGIKETLRRWGIRALTHPDFDLRIASGIEARSRRIILRRGNGDPLSVEDSYQILSWIIDSKTDQYVLVYYPGLSVPFMNQILDRPISLYEPDRAPAGWYLISKEVYPGSLNKAFEDQVSLRGIGTTHDVADISVVRYAVELDLMNGGGGWDKQKPYIYKGVMARCRNAIPATGKHASIGSIHESFVKDTGGLAKLRLVDEYERARLSATDIVSPFMGLATVCIA